MDGGQSTLVSTADRNPSQMQTAMNALDSSVDRLIRTLGFFEGKLAPVIRGKRPEPEAPRGSERLEPEEKVGLARAIIEQAMRINAVIVEAERMLIRIEL